MATLEIALIGNPNCGKTTLFNKLTGARQSIGNWCGVTVERKTGFFTYQDQKIRVVDLPGVHTLIADKQDSVDAQIANQYLQAQKAELYINIVDGSNLEKGLFLTSQLLDSRVPMVVVVNMLDVAETQGISLRLQELSKRLHCPVIGLTAHKGFGVQELKDAIVQKALAMHTEKLEKRTQLKIFADEIEVHIENSVLSLPPGMMQRWSVLHFLEGGVQAQCPSNEEEKRVLTTLKNTLEALYHTDADMIFYQARFQWCHEIVKASSCLIAKKRGNLNNRLDAILLNRWLGFPVFLFIMYVIFQFSVTFGGLIKPIFDDGSKVLFVQGVSYLCYLLNLPGWLNSIISQGVGGGINTVLSFFPQIGLLFITITFLEDSGYMARAACVMDRFMQAIGLPGKSFIPLIVGFGCNVPAIMGTRILDRQKDRILTCLMTPFISCGARLAIFVAFGSIFFAHNAGLIVFCLYLLGLLIAVVSGFIFRWALLKNDYSRFVIELPNYHVPQFSSVCIRSWTRLKSFLIRAGRYIVPVSVLICSLNSVTTTGRLEVNANRDSLLSNLARVVTPVLHPIGISDDNWPATVGLVTGGLAKEIVIGTLNGLYGQNKKTDPSTFAIRTELQAVLADSGTRIKAFFTDYKAFSNPFSATMPEDTFDGVAKRGLASGFKNNTVAFAYLLFVLLYVPCVSTFAAMAKETGKNWALLSIFWSVLIAYCSSVLYYQVATLALHPQSSVLWIGFMLFLLMAFVLLLKLFYSKNRQPKYDLIEVKQLC